MQPVSVPCYQTVPVTEYQACRQTVTKPVLKTDYIEQPCTEYRPITETRTCQIPTCTYQPVTEYIPQTRDCGCWRSYCQCNPRMCPCDYDSRPGLVGWLNRTGYSIRSSMTPPVTYRRQWVPNYITTMVPVTRMVAQHSVREQSYQVTRLEPHHTRRRVAVNRVEYETAEIVTQRPVTVMKTVPIGTSVAWVPFGTGAPTATASRLTPTPDRFSDRRLDKYEERKSDKERYERRQESNEKFEKADPTRLDPRSGMVIPQRRERIQTTGERVTARIPSAAPVSGWVARRSSVLDGRLDASGVAVAEFVRPGR
jgi:hypothetical protein